MKKLMDDWRQFLKEEAISACREPTVNFDEFLNGVELAAMDPDVRKEKIESLKASGENIASLNKAMTVVGLLSSIPGLQISAGIAAGAGVIGVLASVWRARQEQASNKGVDDLLKLLCIDEDLLDTIANEIENHYWTNSDIKDRIENYISAARANTIQDPMPDFTAHFVDWLNDDGNSPYSKSDDTKIVQGT
jgi:hypothetical protein